MRSVCLIVFSAVIVASAGPLNPWGAPDDRIWPAASAFAGPGIAYAGGGGFVPPFGFPFGMPPMFPFGMVPFPAIPTFPQPWYKGPNVCQETKYFNEPDEVKDLMNEPSIKNYDFSQESESCRGNGEVYVCTGKTMTNEGARMYATKYKCCHGFVRVYDARGGCVESNGNAPPANPNNFQQSAFQSSSSSNSGNAQMAFVPLDPDQPNQ